MRFLVLFFFSVASLLAADIRPFIGAEVGYGSHSQTYESDGFTTSGTSWAPEVGARVGITVDKNHRVYAGYRYRFPVKVSGELGLGVFTQSTSVTTTIPGSTTTTTDYTCLIGSKATNASGVQGCNVYKRNSTTGLDETVFVPIGGTVENYYYYYKGTYFLYGGFATYNVTRVDGTTTTVTPDKSYTTDFVYKGSYKYNIDAEIAMHKIVAGYDYIFDNGVFIGISGGVGIATGEATISSTYTSFLETKNISYVAGIVGANLGYEVVFNDNSKLDVGIRGEYITAGEQTITVEDKDFTYKPKEYNVGLYFAYNFSFGSKKAPNKK